jgi:MYXO-CTERM domain-containing protein
MKRQRLARTWGALLALAALCGWSRTAAACGACECQTEPRSIVNLIRSVPLNLEIPLRVVAQGEAAPRLERVSDGLPAPATVDLDAGGTVWWLKVDEDLKPNTEYRIVGGSGAQFTTGTARDEQAPTLGGVSAMAGGNAGLCDVQVGGKLTLSGANDDNEQFAVWLELEIDVASTAQHIYLDYDSGSIRLGHSAMGCFGPSEVTGIAPDQGYPGRIRLHDAAGHASDWQTFAINVAAEEPGGCGTPSGSAGVAGMSPTLEEPTSAGGADNDDSPGAAAASSGSKTLRTSKGCGCALGAERGSGLGGAGLLTLLLAFAARRRRSYKARNHRRTASIRVY